MNSKDKGNIGQAAILFEFVRRGIQVAIPYGDNARYDLIAQFNNKLNKIQIKYCDQEIVNHSISIPCSSSTNHTTNKHLTTYENDVDYIACYIPKWEARCLIPIKEVGSQKAIRLRKQPPTSGQQIGIRLIEDYSFDKILCVETIYDEPESNKEMAKTQSRLQQETNVVK